MPPPSHPRIVTIERHILEQQKRFPSATGELTALLYDMALAAKLIARETTRAGLAGILGMAEGSNTYGERQQKLDVFADEIIFKMNDHTGRLCVMASEEHDDLIPIPDQFDSGKYVLLYDPLDGSSNIDVNVSIGTIFTIHRKVSAGPRGSMQDVLQPASRLVAAGYVIFGSATMMVYTTGQGVHGFTLDPGVGEFLLTHEDIRMPEPPRFYSVNQGYERDWSEGVRLFTRWLQALDEPERTPLQQRYVGSMVSDFHRNLLHGGIYYYPADVTNRKPFGKLRLMFEAQAFAFLAHHAGGACSDGIGPILDLRPHDLHQRVPVFVGNRSLVARAEAFIRDYDANWAGMYRDYREQSPTGNWG
jgi:fructose-1,6-bisphosphatase I